MRTNQDTPLIAKAIKRLRKGVYEIELRHPSGRLYEREHFIAPTMQEARAMCLRLYPSTVFVPKGKAGRDMIKDFELLSKSKPSFAPQKWHIPRPLIETGIRFDDEPTLEQTRKRRMLYNMLRRYKCGS